MVFCHRFSWKISVFFQYNLVGGALGKLLGNHKQKPGGALAKKRGNPEKTADSVTFFDGKCVLVV